MQAVIPLPRVNLAGTVISDCFKAEINWQNPNVSQRAAITTYLMLFSKITELRIGNLTI